MASKQLQILLEEEEDDDLLLSYLYRKRRRQMSSLYETRSTEGFYSLLINNHLAIEDEKFRQYFRLNQTQFNYVLSLVETDIQKRGGGISPREKLSITLRYVPVYLNYCKY